MADLIRKSRMRSEKKIGRIRIGFNVLVQIVLILFVVAMVNSFAFKHYSRWDFSRDQKYALSDKTKRFVNTLKDRMRITVFFAPNTPITGDVQNLLTEYQYAGKGKVDIEHIDPERNLSRAKELFDKYKVQAEDGIRDGRFRPERNGVRRRPACDCIQRRASHHQCDDGSCRREKEDPWLCRRSQGTIAFGKQQPDHRAENVYRKRKHQVSGTEPARSRCNPS